MQLHGLHCRIWIFIFGYWTFLVTIVNTWFIQLCVWSAFEIFKCVFQYCGCCFIMIFHFSSSLLFLRTFFLRFHPLCECLCMAIESQEDRYFFFQLPTHFTLRQSCSRNAYKFRANKQPKKKKNEENYRHSRGSLRQEIEEKTKQNRKRKWKRK